MIASGVGGLRATAASILASMAKEQADPDLLYARGRDALLSSRLEEAKRWLMSAALARPDDDRVLQDLAWAYYRANEFSRAASIFQRVPGAPPALIEKLSSFETGGPYELAGADETVLPFLLTDPLPLVSIHVEGRKVDALIDTGGAELILDSEFAGEIGVRLFGSSEGLFAGGRRASVTHGRVELVSLGAIEVQRVPVQVLPTRRFSPLTSGRFEINAIIGTNLLAQFRETLDYPAGRLVLERPGREAPSSGVQVPFVTERDHFMISDQGWLNGVGPLRFFVDSGLAGGAFTCPAQTLRRAGIPIPSAGNRGGVGGGGGPVATGVFPINELGLGPLRQRNLTGIYVEPANGVSEREGWGWDGIISHGFLRRYQWTIDWTRSRFVFSAP
jgi:hypothetical protein